MSVRLKDLNLLEKFNTKAEIRNEIVVTNVETEIPTIYFETDSFDSNVEDGDLVYYNSSTGKYEKANIDDNIRDDVIGIAYPINSKIFVTGVTTIPNIVSSITINNGDQLYLSNEDGKATTEITHVFLGFVLDTVNNKFLLNVQYNNNFLNKLLRTDITKTPDDDNAIDLGSTDKRFRTIYSYTFDGVATTATYADLAEIYSSRDNLEPGDVVIVDTSSEYDIKKSDEVFSDYALGVISENPGFLLNKNAKGYPVALKGRVKCKVYGKVKKGDLLVSYYDGCAISINNIKIRKQNPRYIGISLENKETEDVGYIDIFVV